MSDEPKAVVVISGKRKSTGINWDFVIDNSGDESLLRTDIENVMQMLEPMLLDS